jgi:hypothetical protein
MDKQRTVFLVLGLLLTGAITFFLYGDGLNSAYGLSKDIVLKDPVSFYDNSGRLNIVGVVDNNGKFPVDVTVGVNVTGRTDNISSISTNGISNSVNSLVSTVTSPTYAKVIYPGNGAPFKIAIPAKSIEVVGQPFINSVIGKESTYYDVLELNYSNMAVGSERALIGTLSNLAPFPVYNATVFASVHDSNQAQIDSASAAMIPILEPGQKVQFKLSPDKSIKSNAVYYSCAGVDLDAPITTVATPDGGFIPFDLQAIAKIIDLKYDAQSKSLVFGVDHYNPEGGMITLKLPQVHDNQELTIIMDGLPRNDVKMIQDGKTIKMEIFIPPNEHQIQVEGVSHVT